MSESTDKSVLSTILLLKCLYSGYLSIYIYSDSVLFAIGLHYAGFFFFRLYVQWRFMRGIEAQFLALQKGFSEIIPQQVLRPFDERELEVSSCFFFLSVVSISVLNSYVFSNWFIA